MLKRIVEGRVLRNEEIAEDIYKMIVHSPLVAQNARPGQFVNLYPKSRHTLLPRPISLCEMTMEAVTLVYGVVGAGTTEFSGYLTGERLKLSTPQGNGFDLKGNAEELKAHKDYLYKDRIVTLVGGGLGVPPLLALAKNLIEQGVLVTPVLGFRGEPFLIDDFRALGVEPQITTDSGSFGFKGTVIDYLTANPNHSDYYYGCGPKAMLKALSHYCSEKKMPLQVSMEERMGCGYGACLGCVCRTRDGNKKICSDGPVFSGEEVRWDD